MRLDRRVANPQLPSNLPVFEAVPNEIENLLLALGQRNHAPSLCFHQHIIPPWTMFREGIYS